MSDISADKSLETTVIWQWLTQWSLNVFPKNKKKKKKVAPVSDLMWFFHLVCPPGGWQRTRRYEYSAAPRVTLGTLRKLYIALGSKQTDRCWSHYRCDLIVTRPLMNGQGPVVAETEREKRPPQSKLIRKRSSLVVHDWRLDMEKWFALFWFPLFSTACVRFFGTGSQGHLSSVEWFLFFRQIG